MPLYFLTVLLFIALIYVLFYYLAMKFPSIAQHVDEDMLILGTTVIFVLSVILPFLFFRLNNILAFLIGAVISGGLVYGMFELDVWARKRGGIKKMLKDAGIIRDNIFSKGGYKTKLANINKDNEKIDEAQIETSQAEVEDSKIQIDDIMKDIGVSQQNDYSNEINSLVEDIGSESFEHDEKENQTQGIEVEDITALIEKGETENVSDPPSSLEGEDITAIIEKGETENPLEQSSSIEVEDITALIEKRELEIASEQPLSTEVGETAALTESGDLESGNDQASAIEVEDIAALIENNEADIESEQSGSIEDEYVPTELETNEVEPVVVEDKEHPYEEHDFEISAETLNSSQLLMSHEEYSIHEIIHDDGQKAAIIEEPVEDVGEFTKQEQEIFSQIEFLRENEEYEEAVKLCNEILEVENSISMTLRTVVEMCSIYKKIGQEGLARYILEGYLDEYRDFIQQDLRDMIEKEFNQ